MKNKVYIVGDGGREDSLRWKLTQEGADVFKSGTYNEIYDCLLYTSPSPRD